MEKLLFCLGVTKAGTTWLHWSLCRHPGITRVPRKEIHYFLRQYGGTDRLTDTGRLAQFSNFVHNSSLTAPETDHLVRIEGTDPAAYGSPWDADMREAWGEGGASLKKYQSFVYALDWFKHYLRGPVDDVWYERLFQRAPRGNWPIDFSTTNYRVNDNGFARMSRFAEDSRAIILLRDPIDRLWSHVRFHAEVTGDIDNLPNWSVEELRGFIEYFKLSDGSLYAQPIRSLFKHFPEDRRLVLNFEDLHTRPDALFAEVLDFLGLKQIPLPQRDASDARMNASTSVAMPRGALSHLAGGYAEDLEQVAELGVDFVRPWIENARRHAQEPVEIPEPTPSPPEMPPPAEEPRIRTGLGILARRILNGNR